MEDRELVAAALDGDDHAYGDLVRRYERLAFRAAYLVTRDSGDAEEACQEAFVKAHRALNTYRPERSFRPWLLAIVNNQAKNRRRSRWRRQNLRLKAARLVDDPGLGPDQMAVINDERRSLIQAVESLRDDEREIIGYRYFLDLSTSETAEALDIPGGTVKSRLSRAVARLQKRLLPASSEEGSSRP